MIAAMLLVEDAQARVMAEIAVSPPETVPLADALGRVLREEIFATHDLPPSDNSAMDGYAVRAADLAGAAAATPVVLPVSGDIAAGHPAATALEPQTAMRIMTGAWVPDGADTVVQVELTDGGLERVAIAKALSAGANIRRRGEDIRSGQLLVAPGTPIGPAEMTVLAAAERTAVAVGRKPTVAILSTGDELVDVGEPRGSGKIVNTNAWLLSSLVIQAGGVPRMLGIVRDDRDATIAALRDAVASDFVVSSGGVSVGAYDFVKEALDALGAETKFWRVAMKPGKTVVLTRLGESVIFGLPGNPVSCFVSFHLFVAPALRRFSGQEQRVHPATVLARATAPLRSAGDRRTYVRVQVTAEGGELVARPLASQGSGSLTSMLGANGLAILEAGVRGADEGTRVRVLLVDAIA
jgi:molybdopterin molybdotransferase